MMAAMMGYMPIPALVNFSQSAFTEDMLNGIILQLNGYLSKKPVKN
jgi:beta-glucosidase